MVTTILIVALAVYAAALTGLRFAAPKTKTDKDDKVLAMLEKGEPIANMLKEKVEADKAKADAPKA